MYNVVRGIRSQTDRHTDTLITILYLNSISFSHSLYSFSLKNDGDRHETDGLEGLADRHCDRRTNGRGAVHTAVQIG